MNGKEFLERLKSEIHNAVVGKDEVIELLAVALLSEGHVMLEGYPRCCKDDHRQKLCSGYRFGIFKNSANPGFIAG